MFALVSGIVTLPANLLCDLNNRFRGFLSNGSSISAGNFIAECKFLAVQRNW